MDDRYPDFWAESNWPRRPRRDPFRMRLLALLAAGALLTPVALLMRRNDGEVVTTGRLPGAAVALEPVLRGGTATTTTAPAQVPSPPTRAAGTLPPAAGATVANPAGAAAPTRASGAGTLPPTVGTLPVTVAPAPSVESSGGGSSDESSSGGASSGSSPGASAAGGSSGNGSADDSVSGEAADPAPPAPSRRTTTAPTQQPAPEQTPTAPAPKSTRAPTPPPVQYSAKQVEALIRKVFPDDQEEKALAVAWRESRHDPRAYNGWCCYGLFQIYFEANAEFLARLGITSAEQLYDPAVNTSAALAMVQRSGWGPWGG